MSSPSPEAADISALKDMPKAEFQWMDWLRSLDDARPALRAFVPHYHFFSLRQVIAFSGIFRLVDPVDRETLAMLADVLHEELGRGRPDGVHSVLFERFARSIGFPIEDLPLKESSVAPGVRAYVASLEAAFQGDSRPKALASYQFLESSAVETYPPLLEILRQQVGLSEEATEFFALHAEVEIEHAEAAEAMVRRYALDGAERREFHDQRLRLERQWDDFWTDIHEIGWRGLKGL